MKHSRNSQQIQGDFQDFEAPAPAEPEYAGEVTMALPPVPMPDPNARRGLAQPAAKRSVLWSVLGILGEVLMTLAAVCALYVVWQMWWTGVQSEHTQVETRQSASWSDPAGGDSSKVAKAQSGDVPVQPTSASDGELIAQVYVPRFGQGWVRNVVEGTDEAELSLHGLGHYPSTQMPGSVGNFAVAGHRNGYGRPLGDVDLLQEGDAIIVRTKDYWYVYKYTTYKIVTPEHSEVIAANPEDLNTPPSKRMITLTTCEPKYTTATHRWISYGELSYWAKVSDGVPQELATSSNSAKVAFSSSNTSQSFVSKLGTLQPIVLWALVAYLVLYIAALVAWRYPVLREIRAGKRRRPDASIYGWLLRHQRGADSVGVPMGGKQHPHPAKHVELRGRLAAWPVGGDNGNVWDGGRRSPAPSHNQNETRSVMTDSARIVVVDNYDSFVYTIVGYLKTLGATVDVVRNDAIDPSDASVLDEYDGVLISPGPGAPADSGASEDVIRLCAKLGKPMFGVCLGLQALAEVFGCTVSHAPTIMHGKTSLVEHIDDEIFAGVANPMTATRYHSLAVEPDTVPDDLVVTAWTKDDHIVQGIKHRSLPMYAVQFHPEVVHTKEGTRMLSNFVYNVCGCSGDWKMNR